MIQSLNQAADDVSKEKAAQKVKDICTHLGWRILLSYLCHERSVTRSMRKSIGKRKWD